MELITAALAAGAAAGVTGTANTAVVDAYSGLKRLVARRLSGHDHAGQYLDAGEAEPGAWQARLGVDLSMSGAAGDEEILAAARALLELVDPSGSRYGTYQVNDLREAKGVQLGPHSIQHNTFS